MKLLAASFVLALTAPMATLAAEPTAPAPYAMPETEAWDMTSATGRTYRIFVSRPAGEAPEGGYPILYVLDGNAMFAGFAEARRIQGFGGRDLDKMIVVGIGHPGEQVYDARRMEDFTGPLVTPALKQLYAKYLSGGRDAFRAFLLDELKPAIAKRYKLHPQRQALYGHSLGGLFALHLFYSHPGAFDTIVAASPSIWWDDQAILAEEAAWRTRAGKDAKLARRTRLLLIAGELESDGSIAQDSAALAGRLAPLSAAGLRSDFLLLDGETHVTVPHRSITATMRAVMRWP
ncbi:alpha/beta hydrolase [Sphingopyxis sp. KK2]|uniref:alpha/beta hydrolase n=1 Tax=Sphingopyxis sp. KK2 TaxID=1855727 RepID=UPI0009F9AA23|nr:alpha/beta hydrolase-fold protein [Sphingopyxis sp. KK2]